MSRDGGRTAPEQVRVGPFPVWSLSQADVTERIVGGAVQTRGTRPWLAFALHVGGLNATHDREFVEAMGAADLVYADGVSVVALARLAGGSATERSPTTDIGWSVLEGLAAAQGRPVRLALLGGADGLAARAGEVLGAHPAAEVVLTEHGYHQDWTDVLAALRAADPDLVVVGLGAPWEMKWVCRHLAALPPSLVLTCGGWFGFIVSDEKRASSVLQKVGLEWAFRLAQDPARLGRRYATGARATGVLALQALASRTRGAVRR